MIRPHRSKIMLCYLISCHQGITYSHHEKETKSLPTTSHRQQTPSHATLKSSPTPSLNIHFLHIMYLIVDQTSHRPTTESSLPSSSFPSAAFSPPIGPSVHTHSRCRFLRPATGVAGHASLSSSSSDESRLSPARGGEERLGLGLWA